MIANSKIIIVSFESDLNALGFRKIAAIAKSIYSNVEILFVVPYNAYSIKYALFDVKTHSVSTFSVEDTRLLVDYLASKDIVCISSMSHTRNIVVHFIEEIRKAKKEIFILWGGIHPIVYPDDAIQFADAICNGEGESSFADFIQRFENKEDYTDIKNFWFKIDGKIIKNGFHPLLSSDELDGMPFPWYAEDEYIFKPGLGVVPMVLSDYLQYNKLFYDVIWSIGCPNKCIYCSNSKFLANDKKYAVLRHTSVDHIINEVKLAMNKHPHISLIVFRDDNFMAIPIKILEEFAIKWKSEIALPFSVTGFSPVTTKDDKIRILIWAGMLRMRMGIQSGSEKILKFYRRPTGLPGIKKATETLSVYSRYIIPPSYDIIVDNPIEDRQDIIDTLNLVYDIKGTFFLNLYSLRIFPGTDLENKLIEMNVDVKNVDNCYYDIPPTFANVLLFSLDVLKMPRWLYDRCLRHVRPASESQKMYPKMLLFVKVLHYGKKVLIHLFYLDFTVFGAMIGLWFKKLGITDMYYRRFRPKKLSRTKLFDNPFTPLS